jgi:signal peptidase I
MENREIKFRAWVDWGFNEMINDYCFLGDDFNFFGHDRTNNNYKVIAVMQFTGMKDCDGLDIYEGDIIIFKGHEEKYKVTFEYNSYYFRFENRLFYISDYDYEGKTVKVIGNIYQNPELLTNERLL